MLKKKDVKGLTRIEGSKSGRLFDFFVAHGWLGRA
jgi:transcriptional adapter 2-alpha